MHFKSLTTPTLRRGQSDQTTDKTTTVARIDQRVRQVGWAVCHWYCDHISQFSLSYSVVEFWSPDYFIILVYFDNTGTEILPGICDRNIIHPLP